ncbi:MAG: DUF4272 domain-containing protein, partial [Myxococcaceae bacterium]|nr:DUF4272 domain-containing protein [Myxococcaceae bacterium]
PEQVASRMLALGAVLERAQIERDLAAKRIAPDKARAKVAALTKWLEDEGIMDVATSLEQDLLSAEPGDWLEEDLDLAWVATDALAMLLWAAGQAPLPAVDQPATVDAVLGRLPLEKPTAGFIEQMAVKPSEELERHRDLWETYLWRCEQESSARLALAGEDVEFEFDVESILDELEKDGFDAKAAKSKGGQAGLTAEALRFLGRKAAAKLAATKLLTPVSGDFPFRGKALSALDDEDLQAATSMAHERHHALDWVLNGGEWDDLEVDELSDEALEEGEDFDEEPIDEDYDDGSGEGG